MKSKKRAIYLGIGIVIFFAANMNAPATDGAPEWIVTWEQIYAEEMPPVDMSYGCMAYDEERVRESIIAIGPAPQDPAEDDIPLYLERYHVGAPKVLK